MSTTADLIRVLKAELKTAGITYAALARELDMAESSVKRMFAQGDMPLSRIDEICRVLRTDFAELARRVADDTPPRVELTPEQERAVVADRKLLLAAICCLSQWTFEQVLIGYGYTEAELVGYFVQLDRLGIIELKPQNRYRMKVAKTFRWRPHGPVMQFFRAEVVPDYFRGGFDGEGRAAHARPRRDQPAPGRAVQRAAGAHRQRLRPAAPGRPAPARRPEAALHAGDRDALMVVRAVSRPAQTGGNRAPVRELPAFRLV